MGEISESSKAATCTAAALAAVIGWLIGLMFNAPLPDITPTPPPQRLTYMLHGDHLDSGYLFHVEAVLNRFGYTRVENDTDFNLLWSHVYPFGERAPFSKAFLQNLKPFQKVNHVPGSGYFTNKVDLAMSNAPGIPKAFHLPGQKDEVIAFAKENPQIMLVQKSNAHRGIQIRNSSAIDLEAAGTFVQQYVDKPLLVDGHKFDIGIYTVITSVDPLRVYIYDGEALLRFCPEKYYPFDPDNVDKYVVGDDYIPTWEMPSLKKIYNELQFNMKNSLNFFLKQKGKDGNTIWTQINNIIGKVLEAKEANILNISRRYKNTGNFFEMVRFDFIVDENLKVYLMEANMSPNLSSQHFKPNRHLYENVLYNILSLVGVGRRLQSGQLYARTADEANMEVSTRQLMVYPQQCAAIECATCTGDVCALCQHCVSDRRMKNIREAYLEHLNRLECKRIFPPTLDLSQIEDRDRLDAMTLENRILTLWYKGQCELRNTPEWC